MMKTMQLIGLGFKNVNGQRCLPWGGIYVTTLGYERILAFNNRFSFKQCHELKCISLLLDSLNSSCIYCEMFYT